MLPEHISSKEQSFREALSLAKNILILASASLSAASEIPTFRDGGGMWRSLYAMSLATPDEFNADPSLVWKIYHYWRSIALSAQPNDAHHIISKLHEDCSHAICLALAAADESFQTIQDAGTINRAIPLEELPCYGKCGALACLDVVWFGEKPYHIDEINMLVYKADMILVCPASMFAYCVKRRGRKVGVFNLESTLQDAAADFAFTGACEIVLPSLSLELV
ncbi:sirtuin 5 [Moniliophthora roreri]|nr:sirtuin 5 [Moniliophthora roreri]